MRVWMVFVRDSGAAWCEAAWDDDSVANIYAGWEKEIRGIRTMCAETGSEYRVMNVIVPKVQEAFEIPRVEAQVQ